MGSANSKMGSSVALFSELPALKQLRSSSSADDPRGNTGPIAFAMFRPLATKFCFRFSLSDQFNRLVCKRWTAMRMRRFSKDVLEASEDLLRLDSSRFCTLSSGLLTYEPERKVWAVPSSASAEPHFPAAMTCWTAKRRSPDNPLFSTVPALTGREEADGRRRTPLVVSATSAKYSSHACTRLLT